MSDDTPAPGPSPPPSPPPVALAPAERDRVIAALCEHFAHDNLAMDELERRLELANRARTQAELVALVADLPSSTAGPTTPAQVPSAPRAAASPPSAVHVEEYKTMGAFLGGFERRGHWRPARRNIVITVMGGGVLDFREVELLAGTTDVTIFTLMGGVEIIVPPGMAVDTSGFAIMGGFDHRNDAPADPDAPRLRVGGFAMMGGVELRTMLPGESNRDAKRRLKDERRARRRE